MEYIYKLKNLKTNNKKEFSRLWAIDCLVKDDPDHGWLPNHIFQALQESKYLPLEDQEDYPYVGSKQQNHCQQHSHLNGIRDNVEISEHRVALSKEREMVNIFKFYGPVSVCMYVDDMVYYYKNGLFNRCIPGQAFKCNHFVTLLGYNTEYLTVQNSWGTEWGIQGRMNIMRGNCDHIPGGGRF